MRLSVLLVLFGVVCAQIPENTVVVEKVISSGGYSGTTDKQLSRMGDAAAVELARVIGGRTPTPNEIDGALLVLRLAFSNPKLVAAASDRTPGVALFVLQDLAHEAQDPGVKSRIAETRASVENASRLGEK